MTRNAQRLQIRLVVITRSARVVNVIHLKRTGPITTTAARVVIPRLDLVLVDVFPAITPGHLHHHQIEPIQFIAY